ncbi:DUF3140 domain-containing protein [Sphingomonas sp.]|uniref:DUF3140 domain-containing protein n=1 Tax=Sphingomonas sp. TaxID=28214 RepID=UPI003B009C6D
MADDDHDTIYREFKDAVNMTPAEIEKFLDTDDSKRVGQKASEGAESVGHASGRKIVEIQRRKKAELTDADYAHMKKVTGYVARHCKQGPGQDKEHSDWRYSLMNWGHDPLK